MANLFDADTFLDSSAGGPLSTERTLIPEGTYSSCYIDDVKPQEGIIKSGDREGQPWVRINFRWVLDDQALRDKLGRAEVKITQGVMIDLTTDGKLDFSKGKNIRLGKLRQALGINAGDVQWRKFIGIPATIQVKHGINKLDQSQTEEVAAVAGH